MKNLLTSIAILIASISFVKGQELATDILYTASTISYPDAVKYIDDEFGWERIETNDSCVSFKMEHGEVYVCDDWVALFFESAETKSSLWLELFEFYGAPTIEPSESGGTWENFGNWFALYDLGTDGYMLSLDRYILPVEK